MSVGNGPGRRSVIGVIHGIDAAHRPVASLFFDQVGDKPGCVPEIVPSKVGSRVRFAAAEGVNAAST
jgi:hypothetical protein